jgi:hypothetical protein
LEKKKQALFNQWMLYEKSDKTAADAELYEPPDFELMACDGFGTTGCPHPKAYHDYMDEKKKAEKEKAKKKDE